MMVFTLLAMNIASVSVKRRASHFNKRNLSDPGLKEDRPKPCEVRGSERISPAKVARD